MPQTSIITVNYHQPEVSIELLKSLAKHYTANELEVILVDNGAKQSNEQLFSPHFPNLKYIASARNLGFAGGNNLGIAQATGQYIFLLNNDTEVPPNCIQSLIELLEQQPQAGLVSPLLLYYDQKDLIQYAGFTPLNYLTGRNAYLGKGELNQGQYQKNYPTGYCHGAAVMCRRVDLQKAGNMDESYFLYYEELDWCEKFKRIGKEIWFCGQTFVYHKESISVGKDSPLKVFFNTRNRMLFIRKNTGWFNTLFFSIYYSLVACPKTVLTYLLKGESQLAKWTIKALWWNFTHKKNSKDLGFPVKIT